MGPRVLSTLGPGVNPLWIVLGSKRGRDMDYGGNSGVGTQSRESTTWSPNVSILRGLTNFTHVINFTRVHLACPIINTTIFSLSQIVDLWVRASMPIIRVANLMGAMAVEKSHTVMILESFNSWGSFQYDSYLILERPPGIQVTGEYIWIKTRKCGVLPR